jgi:hypothetical protein
MIAAAIASRLCIFSLQLPTYINFDELGELEGMLSSSPSYTSRICVSGAHMFGTQCRNMEYSLDESVCVWWHL